MARSAVNIARTLREAQEGMMELVSIEEAREMIGPGEKMPILVGTPTGTLPVSIKEVDPNKFLPPVQPSFGNTNPDVNNPNPNTPGNAGVNNRTNLEHGNDSSE